MSSAVDGPPSGGLQRHVRHPLHRHVAGPVGERAPVRPPEALELRYPPVKLIAGQDAVADQVPGLRGHALVVVADGGQAVLGGAVAGDMHDTRSVLQVAELVRGGERRAGVGGLVAQRPVELGGVPDRLVDGEPEVRRVDDEVVPARLDRGGRQLGGEQLRQLGQLGGEVPAVAAEELIAPPGGRRQRPHGVEPAVTGDRGGGDLRMQPDPLLGGRGRAVGVELALPDLLQRGVHVADGGVREQLAAPLRQQRYLVRDADRERVDIVRRHPAHLAVTGFGSELDRLGVHRGGHVGDLDGLPRRLRRAVAAEVDGRGEAPRPVHDHPDREAGVVGVEQRLRVAVGQADLLAPDAFGAEVGVLGAEAPGLSECRIRQFPQRQGGEFRVNPGLRIVHAA